MHPLLGKLKHLAADGINRATAVWPRHLQPSAEQLQTCRIVAHRGAHRQATENTLKAFDLCLQNKAWGVEFDLRWTQDNVPIVMHDGTAGRTFGREDVQPHKMLWADLHKAVPELPSLVQVLQLCQGMHKIIEVKVLMSAEQQQILHDMLKAFRPMHDYHLLCLNETTLLDNINFVPSRAKLLVSEKIPLTSTSRRIIQHGWGGLCGHFLFMTDKILQNHRLADQKIGTGFISSKNVLHREIARQVDWIFTDDILEILPHLKAYRTR